jgi:hypothetical protein
MGDRRQPNPPPVQHVIKPNPPPAPPPRRPDYESGYAFRLGQAVGHLRILLDALPDWPTPPLTLRAAIQRAKDFITQESIR